MKLKRAIIMSSLLLLGLWVATQYAAYQLGYGSWLSGSLVRRSNWTLYAPWSLVFWSIDPFLKDRTAIQQAMSAFGLYSAGIAMGFLLATFHHTPRVKAFGASGWGGKRDLKRAGLLNDRGTVVGLHGRRLLTYDGPEHQLVSGASRSGKGVGHVIPTLLCWPRSALVYDIKNELWEITAGFRANYGDSGGGGQHCLYFNPTKPDSACFNPLFEVRKGPNEIRDVQNIVEMLVNPDGAKKTLDVWDQNASQFLTALILHVLYAEPADEKHLGRVRDLLLEFDTTCQAMLTTPHRIDPATGQPAVLPEVGRVAKSLLSQSDRFRSSVRGTAEGYLMLWADENVRQVTSRSDFQVGDLVCSHRPMTLYLQPPPSDADRVRPLIRLVLNQIARALMEHRQFDGRGRRKKHRLLMLIDEFPTLGRLQFFSDNMRQMAGYGIKAQLVVQSFNDIVEAYGPHNTIIDNCHILTAFASADTVTQQRISQMTGHVVEYRTSYSRPRSFLSGRGRTVSQSEHVRPLLQPGDVRTFPQDEQLVFVTGFKPFRTRKLRYFKHSDLKRRVMPPPPSSTQNWSVPAVCEWTNERPKGRPLPLPPDVVRFVEQDGEPPSRQVTLVSEQDIESEII